MLNQQLTCYPLCFAVWRGGLPSTCAGCRFPCSPTPPAGAAHGIPPCPGFGTPNFPKFHFGGDATPPIREQFPPNQSEQELYLSCSRWGPGQPPYCHLPLWGGIVQKILGQIEKINSAYPQEKQWQACPSPSGICMSKGTSIFSYLQQRLQCPLEQISVVHPRPQPAVMPGPRQPASSQTPKMLLSFA